MKIGIDAYPLSREKFTGLGAYLFNLIRELEKIDSDNEYFLYAGRSFSLPFVNSRWHIRLIEGLAKGISTLWLINGA